MTSGIMVFWLLCIDVQVIVANWSFIGIPKLNYVILFLVTVTGPSCPNYRPGKWWTFVHANEIFQFPWLVLAIPCRQRRRTEYIYTLHQCALCLKREHLICYILILGSRAFLIVKKENTPPWHCNIEICRWHQSKQQNVHQKLLPSGWCLAVWWPASLVGKRHVLVFGIHEPSFCSFQGPASHV